MSYATAAGAVSGAVSSYYSAKNSKLTLQGQAEIAHINAQLAESSAQSTLLQGQRRVGAMTLRAGQLKSTQRANLAANGVDLGVGNAAELQASTDIMKEMDMKTAEQDAVMSAWGYRTQSSNYESEAMSRTLAGKMVSPGASAAGSLLSDSGTVASSWYSYNKVTKDTKKGA